MFLAGALVRDLNVLVDHDPVPSDDVLLTFAIFEARIPSAAGHTANVGFHALGALIHPSHFDVVVLAVTMRNAPP